MRARLAPERSFAAIIDVSSIGPARAVAAQPAAGRTGSPCARGSHASARSASGGPLAFSPHLVPLRERAWAGSEFRLRPVYSSAPARPPPHEENAMDPDQLTELQSQYLEPLVEQAVVFGPKLLLALVTLLIGLWLVGRVTKALDRAMDRNSVEVTLRGFLNNAISLALKLVVAVIVITMIGVETTSIVAIFGAAGLAVGLALQGSLANFAGGVLILFFKPFKVGDVIDAQGFLGRVEQIQIFNTIMLSLDNKRIVMPNGQLSNGPITNLFHEPIRRVDLKFGVSYGDDVANLKQVLHSVIDGVDGILADPAREIWLAEHADSSINFIVRVWCKSEDYWPVHFDMMESTKLAFDREDITIPFPQRDVHMIPTA
jgi:small conductance mechanosensitive channel